MAATVFLIIDDHPIFSHALVTLLGDAFPGSLFLTAGTLDQGRRLLLSSSGPPPIVLLDINLPDSKGAHGARELIRITPGLKIIALSAEDARDRQAQLFKSGVHGFLSKTVQPEIFIAKLNELVRAPMRTQRLDSHQTHVGEILSERQKAVIIELARGRSNKEIALSLGIGVETVKTHVSEIIRRLNVRNRAEAIRHFIMRGANIESDE